MTEDKMVGWHHHLDGHEFEQVPGAGDAVQFVSRSLGTRGTSDVNSGLKFGEVEVKCPSSYGEKRKKR